MCAVHGPEIQFKLTSPTHKLQFVEKKKHQNLKSCKTF